MSVVKCPDCGGKIIGMFPTAARCTNWPTCRYLVAKPVRYQERPPDDESRIVVRS